MEKNSERRARPLSQGELERKRSESCDGGGGSNLTWHSGSGSGPAGWNRRQSSETEHRRKYPQFHVGELAMAEFLDDKESMEKKVVVGICAMAKKSNSKPMKEIIKRLENFSRIQLYIFDEDVILNSPVEDWPIVNAFISFFSTGFPLDKAIAYKNLRQPFVVNDLEMQKILQDRTEVYRILEENNIPHPRYAVLNKLRDPVCKVVETEDSIEINGQMHLKPFVEKPIDAEDHNVYIYFPQSAGGGSTRLFRKVKDRSSIYSHTSRVRRNGAYLYEDFMPTDGTDVKVYTVGTDYQHAEARKSPCLDGKVERDQDGKEIRYPVLLSAREKLIARKVVWAFGQNVCGFDLLRANGKCYVCDVNGFSFVKTSQKYYDDCARILGTLMLREVCPTLHIPYPVGPAPEDIPVVPTTCGPMMELRCVVALIRHGDRTPKQKMKMEVKNKMFFELFEKYGGFKTGHLKLKRPKQLQEVLDIVRQLLDANNFSADPDLQDKKAKLQQMKLVLEMYGHFSGINRKVQLKYQPQGRPKRSSSEEDDAPRDPSLLLILKWGGELTPAGRIQAENLGKAFRTLYPGGQGQFEAPGLGFLRLHSTFRHDLKIYASDEGRVQMTAAAFTKGLLALEGELTPILVQMVKSANTNGLLDGEGKTSKSQIVVKEKLKAVFNHNQDFSEEALHKLNPTHTIALTNAMDFVKNPQEMCGRVHEMIKEITAKIRELKAELKTRDLPLYNGESWELLIRRWAKLEKDFMLKCGQFEISKIPDIYDCIKYDLQHNQKTLMYERAQELFMCSKALADIIIPQEYGITVDEKLHIAQNYCMAFLRKVRSDFLQVINPSEWDEDSTRLDSRYSKGVASPERFVRTRLYFTSESHIHSMLNILRYGNVFENGLDSQWERALSFLDATAELNYMSQIVFMLFEDPSKEPDSDERYHMELHFSPGAYTSCDEPTEPRGMGYRPRGKEQLGELVDGGHLPHHLVSAFQGPLPSTSGLKHGLRLNTAAAAAMELGDINESDMFEGGTPEVSPMSPKSLIVEDKKTVGRLPGSPDPNIPDWDWGEDPKHPSKSPSPTTDTATPTNTTDPTNTDPTTSSGTTGEDKDIKLIAVLSDPGQPRTRNNSVHSAEGRLENMDVNVQLEGHCTESDTSLVPGNTATNPRMISQPINIAVTPTSTPDIQKMAMDEKRSRSLEDKNDPVGPDSSSFDRNYKTVHLPLHTDMYLRRSLPSVFTLGFGFGGTKALEGFSYVPQLHPLETLHNTLTYREIDDFLGRVTSSRFPMPAISPTYNRPSLMLVSPCKLGSLGYNPPSSNSSSGPSSPSSVPTPVDFLSNLRMYIGEHSEEAQKSDNDSDSSCSARKDKEGSSKGKEPDPSAAGNTNTSSHTQEGGGEESVAARDATDKEASPITSADSKTAHHHLHTTDCDAASRLFSSADTVDPVAPHSHSTPPSPPATPSSQVQFDIPVALEGDGDEKGGGVDVGLSAFSSTPDCDQTDSGKDSSDRQQSRKDSCERPTGKNLSLLTQPSGVSSPCTEQTEEGGGGGGEKVGEKSSSDHGLSLQMPPPPTTPTTPTADGSSPTPGLSKSNRFAVSRISDDAHSKTCSQVGEKDDKVDKT